MATTKEKYAFCVSDKRPPTCEDGASCDANENPSHWVEIKTEPWVLKALREAMKEMEENRDEADDLVYGDKGTPAERKLRAAYDALKSAR